MATIQVICAHCNTASGQPRKEQPEVNGSPDLDLRPAPERRGTMDQWVQECPNCKLICPDLANPPTGAGVVLAQPDYLATAGDRKVHPLVRKFRAWALVAEKTGMSADAGFAHLHAAWVADDAKDEGLANAQRHMAVEHLAKGRDRGTVYGRQKGAAEALLADVHRRMGRWDEAIHEAERGKSVTDQPFIDALCEYEIALARKHDAGVHTTNEVP
jgi:hypothetical protein